MSQFLYTVTSVAWTPTDGSSCTLQAMPSPSWTCWTLLAPCSQRAYTATRPSKQCTTRMSRCYLGSSMSLLDSSCCLAVLTACAAVTLRILMQCLPAECITAMARTDSCQFSILPLAMCFSPIKPKTLPAGPVAAAAGPGAHGAGGQLPLLLPAAAVQRAASAPLRRPPLRHRAAHGGAPVLIFWCAAACAQNRALVVVRAACSS